MIRLLPRSVLCCLLLCMSLQAKPVRPGISVLLSDSLHLIQGKALGLVTNQTGIDEAGRSTIDLLAEEDRCRLVRLFAPEHGIDGSRPAGKHVRSGVHEASGLPVVSLYNGSREIEPLLLAGLDAVVVDLQDIGIRPYTYISTMDAVLRACALAGSTCIVLDRPNPLGGHVGGEVLQEDFRSFIGIHPIPYVHGMTMGELALLFRDEFGSHCDLRVVPVEGWNRSMLFADTGLPWVPTSPNVPTADTPGLMVLTGGLGELGGLSIGIGTPLPFRLIGHPRFVARDLAETLQTAGLPGVRFLPWSWTPTLGALKDSLCHGVYLLSDPGETPDWHRLQWTLLSTLLDMPWPGSALLDGPEDRFDNFDKAMGSDRMRRELGSAKSGQSYLEHCRKERDDFLKRRQPCLLYH